MMRMAKQRQPIRVCRYEGWSPDRGPRCPPRSQSPNFNAGSPPRDSSYDQTCARTLARNLENLSAAGVWSDRVHHTVDADATDPKTRGLGQGAHASLTMLRRIPHASWLDQVYQFIVINETAQRVKSDPLTDVFGNSLTPGEQTEVRHWLTKSKIDVESRIAAVIAGTAPDNPFRAHGPRFVTRLSDQGCRAQAHADINPARDPTPDPSPQRPAADPDHQQGCCHPQARSPCPSRIAHRAVS